MTRNKVAEPASVTGQSDRMSKTLKSVGLILGMTVGGAVVGMLVTPLVINAVGFGSAGVTANSLAATLQTPFTAAGSSFAILQSVGATGSGVLIGAEIGAVIGAAAGISIVWYFDL